MESDQMHVILGDATNVGEFTFEAKLADIEKKLDVLLKSVNPEYQWEEKVTSTGIQLAGGPTTITKIGYLKGFSTLPTPQGLAIAMLLQEKDTGKFAILSPELVKPV